MEKFNPAKAEAEARAAQPSLDAVMNRAEGVANTYVDPLILFFGELKREIEEMPIAERFSREKKPQHFMSLRSETMLPGVAELSEADYKRFQLLSDLMSIRGEALSFVAQIQSLVMDIEAAKID